MVIDKSWGNISPTIRFYSFSIWKFNIQQDNKIALLIKTIIRTEFISLIEIRKINGCKSQKFKHIIRFMIDLK